MGVDDAPNVPSPDVGPEATARRRNALDARRTAHEHVLLSARRCGRCAERIDGTIILRREACPHCGSRVRVTDDDDPSALIGRICGPSGSRRFAVYAALAVAAFAAGWFPLVAGAVRLAGLLVLYGLLLRPALDWLSGPRRMLARFSVRALLALWALLPWLVDVLFAPAVGVNAVVAGVLTFACTIAYVESSLALIRNRLRRQAETSDLDRWEWLLPIPVVVLFALLFVPSLLVVGAAGFMVFGSIPSISELTAIFLGDR